MTQKPELKVEAGRFYRDGYGRKWESLKVIQGSGGRFLGLNDDDGIYYARWFYLDGKPIEVLNEQCAIISEWIDAPEVDWSIACPWFNYAAMDSDGAWFFYKEKPAKEQGGSWFPESEKSNCSENCTLIPAEYAPKFTGDWKDSLVFRPGVEK